MLWLLGCNIHKLIRADAQNSQLEAMVFHAVENKPHQPQEPVSMTGGMSIGSVLGDSFLSTWHKRELSG